jgi:hypothetical protein
MRPGEHLADRLTELLGQHHQRIHHPARVVRGRGRRLRRNDRPGIVVKHRIRERPTDVHPDDIPHGLLASWLRRPP